MLDEDTLGLDIKAMVSGDKKVTFQFYRSNELWYKTEDGFMFPVPISDIGSATFMAEDRAMLFMRYIRKQIAIVEAPQESGIDG